MRVFLEEADAKLEGMAAVIETELLGLADLLEAFSFNMPDDTCQRLWSAAAWPKRIEDQVHFFLSFYVSMYRSMDLYYGRSVRGILFPHAGRHVPAALVGSCMAKENRGPGTSHSLFLCIYISVDRSILWPICSRHSLSTCPTRLNLCIYVSVDRSILWPTCSRRSPSG